MKTQNTVNIIAVGDVCVNRDNPDSIFELVTPVIKDSDIAFCQLETNFSNRGERVPQAGIGLCADPKNASSIKNAGFNVVSFASNHIMDLGRSAFFDTIENMKKCGIDIFGAGSNIDEARKPKLVEHNDHRITFLAYNSILPFKYWAEKNRPGCTPLRALTIYEPIEPEQPGTPASIHTYLEKTDKTAMIEDIIKAKKNADIVIVSMHWGIHFKEAEIAEYQREAAYAAIDAGADIILGHHAHILKPIELYKNKLIFYSLGNFAFDLNLPKHVIKSEHFKDMMRLNPSWIISKSYKSYPFPADSRMSMACKIKIIDKKIENISILPALINSNSQPKFLKGNTLGFKKVVNYLKKICLKENIHTKFTCIKDEVILFNSSEGR